MADQYSKAIIHAAMDARRLSRWLYLPPSFLRHAALGYLSESAMGRTDAAGIWFDTALKMLTKECHGADGVLAPRKAPAGIDTAPSYKLADYLEQHSRQKRPPKYPPNTFWDAATQTCKDPAVLLGLAHAAEHHSRFHRAARLLNLATARGNTAALRDLARLREEFGDSHGAEQLAREAADRGDTVALVYLAELREESGDPRGAEQLLCEAAGYGDTFALLSLAELREEAGDPHGAEQLLRYRLSDDGSVAASWTFETVRSESEEQTTIGEALSGSRADDIWRGDDRPVHDHSRADNHRPPD